jgi:hypothetical protein
MSMDDPAAAKRPAQQTGAGKAPRQKRMMKEPAAYNTERSSADSQERLVRPSRDHNQRIADFRPVLG